MKAIGIDIGTTSICAVLLNLESGEVERSVTKNSDAFIESENPWEKIQSVEKIITLASEITDSFITDDVSVIGVTGQMHGIVYTDKNGCAVSPFYTWQDERGKLPYKDTTYAEFLNSHAGYGNVTDFYNKENGIKPGNAVSHTTIHDYFVMRLTGRKKALMHTSDAASFGLFDIEKNRFDYDIDIDVTSDFAIAGSYRDIPVAVAIGDNQASVFSSIGYDDILINIGTGSQVSVISDKAVTGGGVEARPYFDGKFLLVGAALCGGRAYSVLKSFFSEVLSYKCRVSEDEVYSLMDEMLKKSVPTSLKADTRFAGTRDDSSVRGSITGIDTVNFTPSALTYAVLEGMIDELYNMYLNMDKKACSVVGSGNGIRKNPHLVKIAEKKFASDMKIPSHKEEAAVGAALFASVANGIFKNAKEAQRLIRYN